MGTDNLFWKRKNRSLKRNSRNRGNPLTSFLIVCEGEKTEPNYFKSFRLSSAEVQIVGCGHNTKSLVEKAIDIRKKAKGENRNYNQVWCVFDKDDFPMDQFNAAIELAKRKKIKLAYSNESFELWYLLHFNFYDSHLSRVQYMKKLSKLLKHNYQKNSTVIYKELLGKQETAIRNAERLLKSYNPSNPGKDNPSTTVHHLVKELNKYRHSPN